MSCFTLEHPDGRRWKLRTLEQVLAAFPEVALVMEGQESEKPIPQDDRRR